MLNTAVLTPMPSPSVTSAIAVNSGAFANRRNAYFNGLIVK
jgi:hypothetical protein